MLLNCKPVFNKFVDGPVVDTIECIDVVCQPDARTRLLHTSRRMQLLLFKSMRFRGTGTGYHVKNLSTKVSICVVIYISYHCRSEDNQVLIAFLTRNATIKNS